MLSRRRVRRWVSGVLVSAALVSGAAAFGAPQLSAAPSDSPQPSTGSADGPAPAEPTTQRPPQPAIDRIEPINDRWLRVFVDSPAMSRAVEVQVLLPRDTSEPRPTVYMLDGRSAAPASNNWTEQAHADRFFEDKNVNVVLTVGGPASFYTDWQKPDPVLGTNKWETFLTQELPPLIDAKFNGNGRNAVMGVSMGAEAAMMLSVRHPQLYTAIAAHSGCFSMGTDLGQAQARAVIASYQGEPDNMFGEQDDPAWLDHDVTLHAEALRGKTIYLSVGSGLPGIHDVPGEPGVDVATTISFGGPLEAATNACTIRLADRLRVLGIPATAHFRPTGTHSWPYWADELVRSWPVIAGALGV
ncbi:S-formylglutathione hydrolase FrmB [Nocardia tenerifensis]|uniref:S-formylglutathione hydrolase FrmB n=1 Tax=Nocardia tenerifensis TaxID=228006 RepID=A0A318K4J7_9NOCA|nr:alpha/beta hydrolase family protein [Nocardia tenerifensis]PXX63133.1 S-formylglutathione hydrolase FrmB [Nocardia tenerifensis]